MMQNESTEEKEQTDKQTFSTVELSNLLACLLWIPLKETMGCAQREVDKEHCVPQPIYCLKT